MSFKKLLIIDDDEVDTYVSKRIIEDQEFASQVVTASSVKEAMDFISAAPAGELPDFIFLDLNMPGQTGLDFLRQYQEFSKGKSSKATVTLLMNVVNGGDPETADAKAHPLVSHVVEKPLTAEKLISLS